MMFIKIGYRNIFRNKRRSLLTSIIIGLGLAAMIITDGFLSGMNERNPQGGAHLGSSKQFCVSETFDAK